MSAATNSEGGVAVCAAGFRFFKAGIAGRRKVVKVTDYGAQKDRLRPRFGKNQGGCTSTHGVG